MGSVLLGESQVLLEVYFDKTLDAVLGTVRIAFAWKQTLFERNFAEQ